MALVVLVRSSALAALFLAVIASSAEMPASAAAVASSSTVLGTGAVSVCTNVVIAQDLVDALAVGCLDIRVNDGARIDLAQVAEHPTGIRVTGLVPTTTSR